MKKLEEYVVSIPDFPSPGIIFRDVTSILQDADGLNLAIETLLSMLKDVDFDVVVGAESRGFIFGTPVAYALHKAFVLARKPGKLPRETVSREYALEYGTSSIEIHKDSIKPGQKVVIIDDLIDCYRRNRGSHCGPGGGVRRPGGKNLFCHGAGRPRWAEKAGKIRYGIRNYI